jgi:methyltransferase (TIGR00027 family)
MEQESQTSVGVAALRAAHLLLDPPPHVLVDPISLRLLGPEGEAGIRARAARFETMGSRALRSHVVLRSRYAEDCAAEAAERGVRRLVQLGAGLDTFAYRQPEWARSLEVLEVDHPQTQEGKRARLASAGLTLPGNLRFVPVDFERTTLDAALGHAEPSFFSWLGVTPYLTEPAIDAVLRFIGQHPPGSEVVFTFSNAEVGLLTRLARRGLARKVAAAGEPFVSSFRPADLERKLRGFGFGEVELLTPEAARARYFAGSSLPPPRHASLARARV